MSSEVIASLAEVGALAIGATALLLTLRSIRDQLHLITFTEYTRRYSEVLSELPRDARRLDTKFDLSGLTPEEEDRHLNPIRRYLNLCSEEMFLHSNKKIDDATWCIWADGIRTAIKRPYFQGAWKYLQPEYAFFPDFCSFMEREVADVEKRAQSNETVRASRTRAEPFKG